MSTRSYSEDLRVRVLESVEGGMSLRQAARYWKLSASCVLQWVRRKQETGSVAAKRRGGHRPRLLEQHEGWLLERLEAKPDMTLKEMQETLFDARGLHVAIGTLFNFLKRHEMSFKKNTLRARTKSSGRGGETGSVAR